MQGSFVGYEAKVPTAESAPPKGSVLTVIVDANTGHVTDWAITNSPAVMTTGRTTVSPEAACW
jgi:hypothetical protein